MPLLLIVCLVLLGSCKKIEELKGLTYSCTGNEVMLQESEVISNLEITETATEYIFSGTMERSDLTHTATIFSHFEFDINSYISGQAKLQYPSGSVLFDSLGSGLPGSGQVYFPSTKPPLVGPIFESEFENNSTKTVMFSATMPKQGTYNIALTKWVLEFTPVCATTPDPWLREQPLDMVLSNK